MSMFGERIQCTDKQPILVRQLLMLGADELINGLHNDVGSLVRRIIGSYCGTIRSDGFSL